MGPPEQGLESREISEYLEGYTERVPIVVDADSVCLNSQRNMRVRNMREVAMSKEPARQESMRNDQLNKRSGRGVGWRLELELRAEVAGQAGPINGFETSIAAVAGTI
jgi:hypothetical protein